MAYQRSDKVKAKLAEKQKAIIKAAKEVFTECGYQGASIKEVARRAGVATGTVYLYLRNKEALFKAIVDEVYETVIQEIVQERLKVHTRQDKLKASMSASLSTLGKHRDLARLVMARSPEMAPNLGGYLAELTAKLVQLVEVDLAEAVEAGEIPAQDIHLSAVAFVGTFYHAFTDWLCQDPPLPLNHLVEALAAYNLRGLGFAGK
ncbi:MAG: TetR/AcrR family transcriptional regulator [Bacillota bacterium]